MFRSAPSDPSAAVSLKVVPSAPSVVTSRKMPSVSALARYNRRDTKLTPSASGRLARSIESAGPATVSVAVGLDAGPSLPSASMNEMR